MRAMILAAGRGERMRPLTDICPKPLLTVAAKPLIVYHLEKLAAAGIREVIINHAYLGAMIIEQLGDGHQFGLSIHYSDESGEVLETGGGIFKALEWLGEEPFWVINGDVWTDLDYRQLPRQLPPGSLAHLLLTDNPDHNSSGDFSLAANRLANSGPQMLTYTGIGLYHPRLFAQCQPGRFALGPLLRQAIEQDRVTGEYFSGHWTDVGTPQRLGQLDEMLLTRYRSTGV